MDTPKSGDKTKELKDIKPQAVSGTIDIGGKKVDISPTAIPSIEPTVGTTSSDIKAKLDEIAKDKPFIKPEEQENESTD